MKDYARKGKPAEARNERGAFNLDRALIIFIITALTLSILSGAYTFYQKWRLTHAKTPITTEKTETPKTPIEKTSHKPASQKQSQTDNPPAEKISAKSSKAKPKTPVVEAKAEEATPETEEPKYDFYQILPKMTVDVDKKDDDQPTS